MTDIVFKGSLVNKQERVKVQSPYRRGGLKQKLLIALMRHLSKTKEEMARFAYDETSFYKYLYGSLVTRYESINSISFEDLPLVSKSAISRVMPFDMLADSYSDRVFKYAETTGSTGMPTPSFYTKKEFQGSVMLARMTPYTAAMQNVLGENRRAVCGLACGFTIAGSSFQNILDSIGFLTINVDARTTIAPPERVARLLSRYKPSLIAASETDFLAWMRILKEKYSEDYAEVVDNLKVLISTAELCSKTRSEAISREFDIIHVDTYACVEGFFSVPCPCGEKHILPIYHTEILDEQLCHSTETGTGRFVFTNLYRKSTPFVRYLLDDLVTISHSDCPYGFTKSIQPYGRYELTVKIGDERYGVAHFENVLFNDYLFGEYQVCLHDHGLVVTAETYGGGYASEKNIASDLEQQFGVPAQVTIVPYGTLRDYHAIRVSKPVLRLIDSRAVSDQKIPEYL